MEIEVLFEHVFHIHDLPKIEPGRMSAEHDVDKQKRSRSKAPRVRSGCITCKARHVKCDETKPTCQRCQQDRRTCDGYKMTPRLKPGPKPKPRPNPNSEANVLLLQKICKDSGLGRAILPRRQASAPMQRNDIYPAPTPWRTRVPRVVSERLFTNDGDYALFNHAQLFVLNHVAFVSDPSDFWHCYAMPLAHGATPLKYAMCALGAAHRHFLFSGPGDLSSPKDEVLASEIAAIEKYNAAIAQIQDYCRHNHQGIDAYIPVICCVVFICIEQLLGRYTESVRHLKGGCSLLESNSDPRAASTIQDLRNAVLIVFYQLGIDAFMFNGDNVLGDLGASHLIPDMGSPHEPFVSYEEASNMLGRVDVIYNVTFASPVVGPERQLEGYHGSESHEQNAMDSAREAFHTWNSRFELLQKSGIPAPDQQPHNLLFSLEQSIWTLLTEMKNIDDPVAIEHCEAVLSKVESVSLMHQSQKHPTFARGGDLLPALALICMSCEDRDTRLRSVSVMRSFRRREGVWDSRELADWCETMILTGQIPT